MKIGKLLRNKISAIAIITLGILTLSTNTAFACCTCGTTIIEPSLRAAWPSTQRTINNRLNSERTSLQEWFVSSLWENNLLPAMMLMTDQMSAVAMHQTAIIGTFMDAKHQMETQRILQVQRARANKDYQPSEGVCQFGTAAKSLAASERLSEVSAHAMSEHFQDRMLGNANFSSATGPAGDKQARLNQFREKFCDRTNSNANMDQLCQRDGGIGAIDLQRVNKDIDYARTVEFPWTLDIDFTDGELTDNEEEILALSNNLYGNEVFNRINGEVLTSEGGMRPATPGKFIESIHGPYMDARAMQAKISVAKNSFNAITSMKAQGTPGSRAFMREILQELGVSGDTGGIDNVDLLLGNNGEDNLEPSYYAQMEVLTKKIYQNPNFYTNLYDKPANIERKKVAMQAIGLMQKFDLYKSYLRYEASLSVLLELAVVDLQDKMEIRLGDQTNAAVE